jgi:hypothetical protein
VLFTISALTLKNFLEALDTSLSWCWVDPSCNLNALIYMEPLPYRKFAFQKSAAKRPFLCVCCKGCPEACGKNAKFFYLRNERRTYIPHTWRHLRLSDRPPHMKKKMVSLTEICRRRALPDHATLHVMRQVAAKGVCKNLFSHILFNIKYVQSSIRTVYFNRLLTKLERLK